MRRLGRRRFRSIIDGPGIFALTAHGVREVHSHEYVHRTSCQFNVAFIMRSADRRRPFRSTMEQLRSILPAAVHGFSTFRRLSLTMYRMCRSEAADENVALLESVSAEQGPSSIHNACR
jgi:hypothetical protein